MPSDELRKRLEAWNGKPLENAPKEIVKGADSEASLSRLARRRSRSGERNDTNTDTRHQRTPTPPTGSLQTTLPFQPLEACLPGAVRAIPGGHAYYHVERCPADQAPWIGTTADGLAKTLEGEALKSHLRHLASVRPEETVFLDLETLGLHGAPLFLVGMLGMERGGSLTCRQLLARDLSEEAGVVAAFAEHIREARLLVTFNGTSFDLPMLRTRAATLGVALRSLPTHLDLMGEARRRYRHHLPNCRLQTLEKHLWGRSRSEDVPGSAIPRVYAEFVREGNAAGIARIAQHNLLDLATTAQLFTHIFGE